MVLKSYQTKNPARDGKATNSCFAIMFQANLRNNQRRCYISIFLFSVSAKKPLANEHKVTARLPETSTGARVHFCPVCSTLQLNYVAGRRCLLNRLNGTLNGASAFKV